MLIGHFTMLNDRRRKSALMDNLLSQLLDSLQHEHSQPRHRPDPPPGRPIDARGTFSVGDFALFVTYIGGVAAAPRWVGRQIARFKQMSVSVNRMDSLVEVLPTALWSSTIPSTCKATCPPCPTRHKTSADELRELQVSGLTYLYPGSDSGIHDISFTMRRGSFTVITGRIGSGKTHPAQGAARPAAQGRRHDPLERPPVDDPATFLVPPRSAYTPQVPRLFSDTLQDNILMGLPPTA